MNHGKTLRIILTGVIAAFMAVAPVAQAQQPGTSDVQVCNQATHNSLGGELVADGSDMGSAAKFQDALKAKKANGKGLVNAASHSAALSLCAAPDVDDNVVVYPGDSGNWNS